MWDVKEGDTYMKKLVINSFTLTMWDVKQFLSKPLLTFQNRFTLTMWDVKKKAAASSPIFFAFYLNYVGCKVYLFVFYLFQSLCFTLTMWDVKFFYFVIICFIN